MYRLAIALGVIALVASLGYGGITWMHSTGDMLATFRLQAAPRVSYVISEPVELGARPRLVLESGSILSAETGNGDEDPNSILRARRLIIDRPVIAVEIAPGHGTGEAALLSALEPVVSRIASLDVHVLSIRDGTVKLHTGTGEPYVFTGVDLRITPHRRISASASGQFTYLGQRLGLSATVARPAASGTEHRWPVQATISSGLFETRFDGVLGEEGGLRLNGAVDVSAPRLREIALWIGLGAPHTGNLEAMRLHGTLDWTGGAMAFSDATLTVDGNEGVGAISVTRSGERTAVEGTMAFKRLDLKPYIASTMVERTLLAPIFAATRPPIIASLLESVDADLRISCDNLVIPGVETGQGAVAITLKNGKLLADVAEVAVEEGVFKGQFVVERVGSEPRYGLNGKLSGVEAGRLLQRALGRNPLQGRADITLSLVTEGDTTEELLAALDGKGQIEMRGGGRLGLDLRALAQSAKRGDVRGWQAAGVSTTGLDELALRVDVHRGVLHTKILQAKSGTNAFSGNGNIDLTKRSLEFAVTLEPTDSAPRSTIGDVMMLSGPWAAPNVAMVRRDEAVHRAPALVAPAQPASRP